MNEQRNVPLHHAAFVLDDQAACPITPGEHGNFRLAPIQTLDATPLNKTVYTPLATGQAVMIRARIKCLQSDGSAAAMFDLEANVRCSALGVLSLLDATTLPTGSADAALAAVTAELSVSGANIIATLTGKAATTLNWSIAVDV